jgi:hypothetical protein
MRPGVFGDGLHIGQIDDAAARRVGSSGQAPGSRHDRPERGDLDRAAGAVDGEGAVGSGAIRRSGDSSSRAGLEDIAEAVVSSAARSWRRHSPARGIMARRYRQSGAGRRCRGHDRHGDGSRPRRPASPTPASRSCGTMIGAGVDQHAGHAVMADALDQKRAAAAAVFRIGGSQAPQLWPSRGTPPDDPQPRMVTRIMRRPS